MTSADEQNRRIIDEFRANGGEVGGRFTGIPLLLLTTTGARSGKLTVSPLVCTEDGDRLIVYATAGGRPTDPAWYRNVVANPAVAVEYRTDRFPARATVLSGAERDRLWDEQVARAPGFGAYQRDTARVIPVVALERT